MCSGLSLPHNREGVKMGWKEDLKLICKERYQTKRDILQMNWNYHVRRARLWQAEKQVEYTHGSDPERAYEAWENLSFDSDIVETLHTDRLRRLADRYHKPMPEGDEFYFVTHTDDGEHKLKFLNSAGKKAFQQTLQEIRIERREAARFWIASAVGIIGALTGLAAVIFRS